uniref:AAA domain-containing protein n=1 Tax=Glossina brevipalpis TaxID=37001 RepID=A0A1A9WEG2_9MUSC
MSDSDADDWFNKNDEDLLKDVEKTLKKNEKNDKGDDKHEEYISLSLQGEFIRADLSLNPDVESRRIKIFELRQMSTMSSIDMFLYAMTSVQNFYKDQIAGSDTQERVLLYTHILATICELDLPGFKEELLESFVANDILMEHFRLMTKKLFNKLYTELWASHSAQMKKFLENMQTLLVQSFKTGLLSEKGVNLIKDLRKIMETCNNPSVIDMQIYTNLRENLMHILNEAEAEIINQQKLEFYPTLEELSEPYSPKAVDKNEFAKYEDVRDYVVKQLRLLRKTFKDPLHKYIYELKNDGRSSNCYLYKDVSIILNEKYLDTSCYEYLFVDVLGSERLNNAEAEKIPPSLYERLANIKTGSLLCFSTSTEFDNLIMATVVHTNEDNLWNGYIAIEIVEQYNIGCIYQKKLLMFEAPTYYEVYKNAYSYLRTINVENFPFKKYIVFGETESQPPVYLSKEKVYHCDDYKFEPLAEEVPEKLFDLNHSQRHAFMAALKRELALIQGPPGTGKTHLTIHLLKTLIKNTHTPIIVLNYANQTLDKFVMKISEHTESIVRFGSRSRMPEVEKYLARNVDYDPNNGRLNKLRYILSNEFRKQFEIIQVKQNEFDGTDNSYEDIKDAQKQLTKLQEKIQTLRSIFQFYVARKKTIIAMTTTFAARNNFLFHLLKSPIVIFEEAAEILESHIVSSLTPYTQHVIMIGDHKQLTPYSRQYPLCVSLFERLFVIQKQPLILTTQYRMCRDIASLLTPTFYKALNNDDSVLLHPSVRKMSKNVYFMTHSNTEECAYRKDETSLYNDFEVDEVIKLTQYFIKNAEYSTEDVVILSPYTKQINRIKYKLLRDDNLKSVKAYTVDSYQGLQADIVLLSLVRSNTKDNIGFIGERHRICVALSRARYGLYMFGNLDILSKCSTYWSQVKKELLKQEAVGSKFPEHD